MYSTSDFRKNLKFEIDGEPFVIVEAVHVKPGKGVAFVKTKFKSLISGNVLERNFRSGDKVEKADVVDREMQYLYKDATHWVFMDTSNYEQAQLSEVQVGEAKDFLKENETVNILFHKGNAISLDLPNFVELQVVQTDPGVKGDTAQGGTKPATLETGGVIMVPLYLNEGELVRVDTRTGQFAERVNK
ncbi:MAG: elongation factor P [Myxococcales bacterium]|nr:elongation factor P [Myxococcales bacterium]